MNELAPKESGGEFLLYQTEGGRLRIEVCMQHVKVWLTINHIAELFQIAKSGISYYLKNIYGSSGLVQAASIKKFLIVRQEGDRDLRHVLDSCNLKAAKELKQREESRDPSDKEGSK